MICMSLPPPKILDKKPKATTKVTLTSHQLALLAFFESIAFTEAVTQGKEYRKGLWFVYFVPIERDFIANLTYFPS